MDPKYLHSNLRFLRNKCKLSMMQVITELGLDIPQNTFASYEDSRENTPKYETLKSLLKFYNSKLDTDIRYEDIHERDLEEVGLNEFKISPTDDGIDFLKNERIKKLELERYKLDAEIELKKLEIERIRLENATKMAELELEKLKFEADQKQLAKIEKYTKK